MKKILLLFAPVLVAGGLISCTFFKESPPATMRGVFENSNTTLGTWWWNSDEICRESSRKNVLDFLTNNGVTEVYLSFNRKLTTPYKQAVKELSALDIKVSALGGDAAWITDDGFESFKRWLQRLEKYQNDAREDEKFSALHLDFEPHQLSEYAANPNAYAENLARVYNYAFDFCEKNNILLEADVSMWINSGEETITDGGQEITVGEFIVKRADTICIMSYRDTAEKQLEDALPMLSLAKKHGKKAVLCSETQQSTEAEFVTYYEEGSAELTAQMNLLKKSALKEYSGTGFAVHHTASWMKLKP